VKRLQAQRVNEAVVLSTHGNLMALILRAFEPSNNFLFWKSLTMPDIYNLSVNPYGKENIQRIWSN